MIPPRLDFSELRRLWAPRSAAIQELHRRVDPTGMTRPPRAPEERRWLEERGELGPFVEVEEYAEAWRAYFQARYGAPPGE